MYARIIINMDNAAFQENDGGQGDELARILTALADGLRITGPPDAVTLRDINGNTVGNMVLIND